MDSLKHGAGDSSSVASMEAWRQSAQQAGPKPVGGHQAVRPGATGVAAGRPPASRRLSSASSAGTATALGRGHTTDNEALDPEERHNAPLQTHNDAAEPMAWREKQAARSAEGSIAPSLPSSLPPSFHSQMPTGAAARPLPMAPTHEAGAAKAGGIMGRLASLLRPRGSFSLAKGFLIGAGIALALATLTANPGLAAFAVGLALAGVATWYFGDTMPLSTRATNKPAAAAPVAAAAAQTPSLPSASPQGSVAGSEAGDDGDDASSVEEASTKSAVAVEEPDESWRAKYPKTNPIAHPPASAASASAPTGTSDDELTR